MRKLVAWVEDNWEAAIALFLLLVVLLYDAIHLIRPLNLPAAGGEAYSYVIMLMLGSITIMLLRLRSKSEAESSDKLVDRLVHEYAGENPFIEKLLRSKLDFLKSLGQETLGTLQLEVSHLLEAVRSTERGDEIQSIDYGPGWKEDFQQLHAENIEAAKRGVRISRLFIIPEVIARDAARSAALWETMVEQAAGGITVRWVAQSDLKNSFSALANGTRGMALFRYRSSDCRLLMLDAEGSHVLLLNGLQPGFQLFWNNHEELRKRSEDFVQLEQLCHANELRGAIHPGSPPPFEIQEKMQAKAPGSQN